MVFRCIFGAKQDGFHRVPWAQSEHQRPLVLAWSWPSLPEMEGASTWKAAPGRKSRASPYPGGQQLWAGSCCCYGVSPALPFSCARDATESLCCGQRGCPKRRAHCIQVPQARIDSLDQQMPLCVASAGSSGVRQLRGQGDDRRPPCRPGDSARMAQKCPEQQAELEQIACLHCLAPGSGYRVWSVRSHSVCRLLQTGLCPVGNHSTGGCFSRWCLCLWYFVWCFWATSVNSVLVFTCCPLALRALPPRRLF